MATYDVFRFTADEREQARIGEEDGSVALHDEHRVGAALKDIEIAGERCQAPFALRALFSRLSAQSAEELGIVEGDGRGVRDRARLFELVGAEALASAALEHQDGDRSGFPDDGKERHGRELEGAPLGEHVRQERAISHVIDEQGAPGAHHLAQLRVLFEVDVETADFLVIAGGHDQAFDAAVIEQHNAASVDLEQLGEAAYDEEQNVVNVVASGEGLGELNECAQIAPRSGHHDWLHGLRLPAIAQRAHLSILPYSPGMRFRRPRWAMSLLALQTVRVGLGSSHERSHPGTHEYLRCGPSGDLFH